MSGRRRNRWRKERERATIDSVEHGRTTIQRKTLIGALLGAVGTGALVVALLPGGSDGGGSERISDVESTTESTTSTVPTTLPPTTAAPTTTALAQPAPIEQQVADHEQRIGTLEATTTTSTVPPAPEPTTTTTSTPMTPCDYTPGDC